MTDYDEKPQALRYRPTPGGLLLNLTVRSLTFYSISSIYISSIFSVATDSSWCWPFCCIRSCFFDGTKPRLESSCSRNRDQFFFLTCVTKISLNFNLRKKKLWTLMFHKLCICGLIRFVET